jgi:Glycosyl transferase family 2
MSDPDACFALITSAKNEEEYLPLVIDAVAHQSLLPSIWIIVDDGSTDRTSEILRNAAQQHSFIIPLHLPAGAARSFDAKDRAIRQAYSLIGGHRYEFVGFIDADIAPRRHDLFDALVGSLRRDPGLGIVGGLIHERQRGVWKDRPGNSVDSVAGGLQVFRRECYEQIGGYAPLPLGGEDWLAQLEAGMRGWRVRVLPDQALLHYRVTSSAGGRIKGLIRLGMMDASFGTHPLFELAKCSRRVSTKPYVAAALLRYFGYVAYIAMRRPRLIPPLAAQYLRQQQWEKLRAALAWQNSLASPVVPKDHR